MMQTQKSVATKTTHVIQGSYSISRRPNEMLTTVLGSCVCTCIYDLDTKIGGMNHFLLAEAPSGSNDNLKYGLHAMELLINELLKAGARRKLLQAKIFGGANMLVGLSDIGKRNSEFAISFLQNEGIPLAGKSLGGKMARRIRFWPASGRTQQLLVNNSVTVNTKEAEYLSTKRNNEPSGAVELF